MKGWNNLGIIETIVFNILFYRDLGFCLSSSVLERIYLQSLLNEFNISNPIRYIRVSSLRGLFQGLNSKINFL
jgi:hypothetical protein